jgi:hypothetical protein
MKNLSKVIHTPVYMMPATNEPIINARPMVFDFIFVSPLQAEAAD